MNLTFKEKFTMLRYYLNNKKVKGLFKLYENNSANEFKRLFGNFQFDNFIHFVSYDNKSIILYSFFPNEKEIFIHSDMLKEIELRNNSNFDILHFAYNHYDKVVPIAINLIEPTAKIKGDNKNIKVVNNLIDYQKYVDMSNEPLICDANTNINIPYEEFVKILNNKKYKKFINIGRFSPEKGQKRLIDAFEKFYKKNKNVYLIIMGGHGVLYNEILEYVSTLKSKNNIIILRSVSNPYNILKRCDLFIMSSFYEGLPMTIMEALILNKPVVSTDIKGPREFLSNGYGCLVPNSEEGVLLGMNKYINNELKDLKPFTVDDAKEFNDNALKEFYSLIK